MLALLFRSLIVIVFFDFACCCVHLDDSYLVIHLEGVCPLLGKQLPCRCWDEVDHSSLCHPWLIFIFHDGIPLDWALFFYYFTFVIFGFPRRLNATFATTTVFVNLCLHHFSFLGSVSKRLCRMSWMNFVLLCSYLFWWLCQLHWYHSLPLTLLLDLRVFRLWLRGSVECGYANLAPTP